MMALRKDQRLEAEHLSLFLVSACGLALFLLLIVYFYVSRSGIEPGVSGMIVGRDFVNLYTAGELLRAGQQDTLFSGSDYMNVLWAKYGDQYSVHNWSYPPTLFFPAWFFSALDYFVALAIWYVFGFVLLAFAVRTLDLPWFWLPLIVFSPAGILNILAGQNGFITASFLVFAMAFLTRVPALSGLSWAVLTIKPHLGLIVLPMLLVGRKWRAIFYGAIAFASLLAATIVTWGLSPWVKFLTITVEQQRTVLESWSGLIYYIVPTAFMQGRIWGWETSNAYALHTVAVLLGLSLAVRAWPTKNTDLRYDLTWLVAATFLILPYSFLYDLVIFQVVLALWWQDADRLFLVSRRISNLLWWICWFLPILSWILSDTFNLKVTPIILALILWRLGTTLHQAKLEEVGA